MARMVAYVRHSNGQPARLRQFGPRQQDSEKDCPVCEESIWQGEYTTLVPLGPGKDAEERQKAADGRFYNAIGLECHYACVIGKEPSESPATGRPVVFSRHD